MRRIMIALGLILMSSGITHAACSRVDVSGSYNYLRVNTAVTITTQPSGTGSGTSTTTNQSFNLNGWNVGAQANVNCWLGIAGEFSGDYGTPTVMTVPITDHSYYYVFGPRISLHNGTPVTPFVEALFGGANVNASANATGFVPFNVTTNRFAANFGGGVDVRIAHHWAIRGRADYVLTEYQSITTNNFSLSGGLVFKFGGGS